MLHAWVRRTIYIALYLYILRPHVGELNSDGLSAVERSLTL